MRSMRVVLMAACWGWQGRGLPALPYRAADTMFEPKRRAARPEQHRRRLHDQQLFEKALRSFEAASARTRS